MQQIDDEKILVALCCGRKCECKNGGLCHRWDFISEARRIRQLIDDWLTEQTEKEGA